MSSNSGTIGEYFALVTKMTEYMMNVIQALQQSFLGSYVFFEQTMI